MSLVLVDAIVTRRGLNNGFREANPIMRYFLERFGSTRLAAARIVALSLLLFGLLDSWEWILFSSTFLAVMGYVVLAGVKKTYVMKKGTHETF
jgi:hypothetical protein